MMIKDMAGHQPESPVVEPARAMPPTILSQRVCLATTDAEHTLGARLSGAAGMEQ
jgi:hypothetical protein